MIEGSPVMPKRSWTSGPVRDATLLRKYTSYKVANLPIEFSTSIPRTQLRPGYGDGFLGAPLQSVPSHERPSPRMQGGPRGTSRTHRQHNPGGAQHICTELGAPGLRGAGVGTGGADPPAPRPTGWHSPAGRARTADATGRKETALMNPIQVAIYARVSSEQQAEAHTVASQVVALRERVAADDLTVSEAMQFLDEGYSGATLVRPALERLRDVIAAGSVDRLYVHSPDRLARQYAYQVLLVDEFRRAGVEIIFLTRALGQSPEDDLLLQVQGMIAEYERAKIIERHRRGKRHAARVGVVNVLSGAPYGYRYVPKYEGGGQAR